MPESNNTNDPRVTVVVPAPQTGAEVAVTSEAGGTLKFDFDPATATATRPEGTNDLVFDVDGGGRVVIGGFFEVGDNTLPDLTLPDGTVVAATDFFAGSDLDLTTAAGPGAGTAGSGGTNYDDDGGALLAGLGRYGMLGTDYWARTTEAAEDPRSLIYPSADISIGIDTTIPENPDVDPNNPHISGTFNNMLFEDGKANQHLYGQAGADETPGQLVMTIVPGIETTIDNVAVTGFPAGTRIEIGDGRTVDILDSSDVVNFTFAESQGQILIFHPADNSDADYDLDYVVTASTPDFAGVEFPGSFTVVVDAVADLPEINKEGDNWKDGIYHADNEDLSWQESGDGKTSEASEVRLPVSATFTDNDGSEHHYFIVENIPEGWTLSGLPEGWVEVAPADYPAGYTPGADGQSFVIRVPYAPQDGDMPLEGTIAFNPGDWTNSRDAFGDPHTDDYSEGVNITVKAAAWEHEPDGGEVTDVNNYAETVAEGNYRVSITEDTPDFIDNDGNVIIVSDESAGLQNKTHESNAVDENGNLKDADVATILAGIGGLEDKNFLSAASNTVRYDLKSDGKNDPNPLPAGEPARYGLGFDVPDGTPTGWSTTATDDRGGATIFMYQMEGGNVVGRVGSWDPAANDGDGGWVPNPAGEIAFVATVTGGTFDNGINDASVTFVQYMSLNHGVPGQSHNESMAEGDERYFLGIDLVVRDEEGDEGTVEILFDVRDDGPVVSVNGSAPLSPAVLDESPLPPDGDGVRQVVWSGNNVQDQFTTDYGADGKGDGDVYALNLDTGTAGSVGSGLYALSPHEPEGKGEEITLSQNPATGDIIGSANGVPYFTLTIDTVSGEVTIALLGNLWHPSKGPAGQNPDFHDDAVWLDLAASVLTLTKTVTDGDGDTATASIDLGNGKTIAFEDDGPSLEFGKEGTDTLLGAGAGGTIDPGQSASLVMGEFDGGTDGIRSVTITGPNGSNVTMTIASNGKWSSPVEGFGTLTLDPYTGELTVHVDHGCADGVYAWTVTITDNDGDTATDTVEYEVKVSNPFEGKFDGFVVDESHLNGLDSRGNPLQREDGSFIVGTKFDMANRDGVTDTEPSVDITQAQLNAFSVIGPNGPQDISLGENVIEGEYGTLTVTVTGPDGITGLYKVESQYELKSNYADHDRNAADADYVGSDDKDVVGDGKGDWNETEKGADSFQYKVGDNPPTSVGVDILDDGLGDVQIPDGTAQFEIMPENYNIVLCVDMSGSMLWTTAKTDTNQTPVPAPWILASKEAGSNANHDYDYGDTRIFATQVSILKMLAAYEQQIGVDGEISVDLIGFNTGAKDFGGSMTVAEAMTAVSNMVEFFTVTLDADGNPQWEYTGDGNTVWGNSFMTGGTQYAKGLDEMLDEVRAALSSDSDTGTRVYFMSDGEDNSDQADNRFDSWQGLITQIMNDPTILANFELHAVGMDGLSTDLFDPILGALKGTDNGSTHTIPSDSDLQSFIDTLVGSLGGASGSFDLPVTADGVIDGHAFVQNVTVEYDNQTLGGDTVKVNAEGFPDPGAGNTIRSQSVEIETDFGSFTFYANGKYVFIPSVGYNNLEEDLALDFTITFMDADGDTLEKTFNFTVEKAPEPVNLPPVAEDDSFRLNESGGSIVIDGILDNDSDPDGTITKVTIDGKNFALNGDGTFAATGDTATVDGGTVGVVDGKLVFTHDGSEYTGPYSFDYTVTDDDGLTADANVRVGMVDKMQGDYTDDTLTAGAKDTLVIGDKSGADTEIIFPNYNISLVLDLSNSMNQSKFDGRSLLEIAKSALTQLAAEVAEYPGTVNIQLVGFATHGQQVFAKDDFTVEDLPALLTAITQQVNDGGTNYEAGFNFAYDWLSAHSTDGMGSEDGYLNKVFFLTDGAPTFGYRGDGGETPAGKGSNLVGDGSSISNEVLAESLKAYNLLLNADDKVDVHAIGLGSEDQVLTDLIHAFDNTMESGGDPGTGSYTPTGKGSESVYFPTGEAEIVSTEDGLLGKLAEGMEQTGDPVHAGSDTLTGGIGNDILFGDRLIMNDDGQHISGYDDVAARIAGKLGVDADKLTLADAMEYIGNHQEEFNVSTGFDKADIINGGAGDDIIFAGGGNDIVQGGTGDDILFGGSGADTFAWQELTSDYDGDYDKIMDFSMAEGDKLGFADTYKLGDLVEEDGAGTMAISSTIVDGHLVLTLNKLVGDETVSQKVEVNFQEDGIKMGDDTYSDLQSYVNASVEGGLSEAQALQALVEQMIING